MKYINGGYNLTNDEKIKAIFIDHIILYVITNINMYIFNINEVTHSISKLAEHTLDRRNQSIPHNYYYQGKFNLIIDVSEESIIIMKINDDHNINVTFINYKVNITTLKDIDNDFDNHILFIAAGDMGLLIIDYSNATNINDIKLDNTLFQIDNSQYGSNSNSIDIRQVSYFSHNKTLICFDKLSKSMTFLKYNSIKDILLLYHNEYDKIQDGIISFNAISNLIPSNNNDLNTNNTIEDYVIVITNDLTNNTSNKLISYTISIPDINSNRPKTVCFKFSASFNFTSPINTIEYQPRYSLITLTNNSIYVFENLHIMSAEWNQLDQKKIELNISYFDGINSNVRICITGDHIVTHDQNTIGLYGIAQSSLNQGQEILENSFSEPTFETSEQGKMPLYNDSNEQSLSPFKSSIDESNSKIMNQNKLSNPNNISRNQINILSTSLRSTQASLGSKNNNEVNALLSKTTIAPMILNQQPSNSANNSSSIPTSNASLYDNFSSKTHDIDEKNTSQTNLQKGLVNSTEASIPYPVTNNTSTDQYATVFGVRMRSYVLVIIEIMSPIILLIVIYLIYIYACWRMRIQRLQYDDITDLETIKHNYEENHLKHNDNIELTPNGVKFTLNNTGVESLTNFVPNTSVQKTRTKMNINENARYSKNVQDMDSDALKYDLKIANGTKTGSVGGNGNNKGDSKMRSSNKKPRSSNHIYIEDGALDNHNNNDDDDDDDDYY